VNKALDSDQPVGWSEVLQRLSWWKFYGKRFFVYIPPLIQEGYLYVFLGWGW